MAGPLRPTATVAPCAKGKNPKHDRGSESGKVRQGKVRQGKVSLKAKGLAIQR